MIAPLKIGGLARADGSSRGPLRLLIALCLVSIVVLTIYMNEGSSGPIHLLRSATQTIATPFRWAGAQLERPFDTMGNVLENATADSATLSELREENESLLQQLTQLNEYRAENERLGSLLSLSNTYQLHGIAARVISASDDTWNDTVEIDKGSAAGVKMDMPVTVGTGLIGQVVSVGVGTSTVRLLSDPATGISALLQDTRTTGILTGSVDGSLHLEYVGADVDVGIGELVVTSGLGGTYPKGLPLGRVQSTSVDASGSLRTITVEPISTASNLEEVYVVTSFDEESEPEAPASDVASQDAAQPDVASPDAATPDADTPVVTTPDVAMPDADTPVPTMPDVAMPDADVLGADVQQIPAASDVSGQ